MSDFSEISERKTQDQLSHILAEAAAQVTVGARYMHYKQQSYKVLALAFIEATNEPCVVYQAEYGSHITFVRPLTDWIAQVEVAGKKVNRFTRIAE